MQSELVGFRYASSRWLALTGGSLVLLLLVLEYFSLLGTLDVAQFLSSVRNNNT
jgi:hypothetical protein